MVHVPHIVHDTNNDDDDDDHDKDDSRHDFRFPNIHSTCVVVNVMSNNYK